MRKPRARNKQVQVEDGRHVDPQTDDRWSLTWGVAILTPPSRHVCKACNQRGAARRSVLPSREVQVSMRYIS